MDCVHEWGEWVDQDLVCLSNGIRKRTCLKCGKDNYLSLDIVPHDWGEWDIQEATCTTTGKKTRICNRCGEKETIILAKIPHNFVNGLCSMCQHKLVIGAYIVGYDPRIAEDGSQINISYTSMGSYVNTSAGRAASEYGDGTNGNGSGNQTFSINSSTEQIWKILGIDDGNIIITTADGITADNGNNFKLRGRAGYVNLADETNKISSIYGHGKYAKTDKYLYTIDGTNINSAGRSINFDDVTRLGANLGLITKTIRTNEDGYVLNDNGTVSQYSTMWYWGEDVVPSEGRKWKNMDANSSITIGVTRGKAFDYSGICNGVLCTNNLTMFSNASAYMGGVFIYWSIQNTNSTGIASHGNYLVYGDSRKFSTR